MLAALLALFFAAPQSQTAARDKSQRASVLVQSGAPEQAVPIYKELVAAFPNEPSFRVNLSIALFKAGRYSDTIAQCDALLKQHQDLFPAWLFLGASHLKLGDASAAEAPLKKALDMQPGDPNARLMLADVLSLQKRWPEAVEQYEAVSKALLDNPRVWFGLGRGYDAMADDSSAKAAYAHLERLPPSREQFEAKALAEEKLGRYPTAAAAWKEAVRLDPSDPQLQKQLALALCHSNDCVSALPLLQNLLARNTASAELNYLCGLALLTNRNAGQALPYLETAVRLDEAFLPARAVLGEAYLQVGKPDRAIPQLKAALADDDDGHRHYQLAQAYQAAGMNVESNATIREYREIQRRRKARITMAPEPPVPDSPARPSKPAEPR